MTTMQKDTIKCPRCLRYLLIQFLSESNSIKLFCLCSKFTKIISLSSFSQFISELSTEISFQTCEKMQSHNANKAIEYCINCDKWLCKKCVDVHMTYNSNHKYNTLSQEVICTLHNKKQKMGLCLSCVQNLCRDCISSHNKNHIIFIYEIEKMSKKIDALKEELAKAKENIVYYSKLINFCAKNIKKITIYVVCNKRKYIFYKIYKN